jgi:intein/homing endonuclease
VQVPGGLRAIAELKRGDRVISWRDDRRVTVKIAAVTRCAVEAHTMQRIRFANGAEWEVSAPHPLADGRTAGELRPGDSVAGVAVRAVETVAYREPFTYDILPDSDSAVYFAEGLPIGSTLASQRD